MKQNNSLRLTTENTQAWKGLVQNSTFKEDVMPMLLKVFYSYSTDTGTCLISLNWRMDEENMVHLHNELLKYDIMKLHENGCN